MNEEATPKPEGIFYWIALAGLGLNFFGVLAYIAQITLTPQELAELPEGLRAAIENEPTWATAAYAIGVFGGAIGCALLLFRRAWAMPVLIASLAGVGARFFYAYVTPDVAGGPSVVTSITPLFVSGFLVWYTHTAMQKGWLK